MIRAAHILVLCALFFFSAEKGSAQSAAPNSNKTMTIEIWSDVMCPFCYIGKRHFENALAQFEHRDQVNIVWKSFQLDPTMTYVPGKSMDQMLAEKKGWTLEYAKEMNAYVVDMAAKSGLKYNMDIAVPANSFDAHRFTHFAQSKGKQDAAEEALFNAYFCQGKNVSDAAVLAELGVSIGLDGQEILDMLKTNQFKAEVEQDLYEAQQVGARGVPFFVLERKYAISGAQPVDTFVSALNQMWSEQQPVVKDASGAVCAPDGTCAPTK
jgi:predicted DsbA family dithiol-disulfide isomerase